MKTQVGIIGAGPAGLLLAHLLHLRGIDSVVLETPQPRGNRGQPCARAYSNRARSTCSNSPASAKRMRREGMRHEGVILRFDGENHRIPLAELTGGRAIMVYAQHEVIRDLVKVDWIAAGPSCLA